MRTRVFAITALTLLAIAPGGTVAAQDFAFSTAEGFADEIETDRDSFTPATTTAGRGRVIVESAYTFIDNRGVPETHSFPELLMRVGLGERLELRLGWNYEVGGAGNPVSGNVPDDLAEENVIERESRVLYGFKATVNEQRGWVPENALIVQGFTPTSGEATDTQMSVGYVCGWVTPAGWTWDSAIRYSTSSVEEDRFDVWAPSTVLKIPLGERWKVHAEYFGVFSDGREDETVQHFFSPGAHYLVTPNLEIGVRVGWGLNDQSPNFFCNSGFGWRF
ncbi:MAG: transporter [Planctomycetales bacterium]|nr:transporter [Planctomycetales bacterium]